MAVVVFLGEGIKSINIIVSKKTNGGGIKFVSVISSLGREIYDISFGIGTILSILGLYPRDFSFWLYPKVYTSMRYYLYLLRMHV